MARVVSITHNAVERDSRALKSAESIARLGHTSIVIEGEPSGLDRSALGFELRLLGQRPPEALGGADPDRRAAADGNAPPPAEPPDAPGTPGGLVVRVGARLPEAVRRPLRPLVESGLERYGDALNVLGASLHGSRRLWRSLPEADLYYLHSPDQFPAAYGKAKRNGAKLVYDAHDANWALDPEVDETAPSPQTLRLMERIDRLCSRRVDGFLTVGAALADLLERHFGRRPVVVRNCHDFRLDEPSPTDVRSEAGVPEDAFLMVMTGAPKPGDTVAEALRALVALPDVHLALVGKGTSAHSERVEASGLGGRVHLLDAVPPTQVASFIRSADASPILYRALSPAYEVSLPNRFFHAIAAGLPILYPPLPEIRALCEQHQLGIGIDPRSPDSIAAGVAALLEDEAGRARYAGNVERAQSVLSWEHEERTLARLLGEVLGG